MALYGVDARQADGVATGAVRGRAAVTQERPARTSRAGRRAPACTPDPVLGAALAPMSRHLSGTALARRLERPTRSADAEASPAGRRVVRSGTVWPCTPRGLPGRARRRTRRWALTPPFHPSPVPADRKRSGPAIGWSALCCTCRRPVAGEPVLRRPRCWRGAVPCGVRTFLTATRAGAAAAGRRTATIRPAAGSARSGTGRRPFVHEAPRGAASCRRPRPRPPGRGRRRRGCGRRARRR